MEQNDQHRVRVLDVDVRVGDYALDNTHQIRGGADGRFGRFGGSALVPLEKRRSPSNTRCGRRPMALSNPRSSVSTREDRPQDQGRRGTQGRGFLARKAQRAFRTGRGTEH
jgi:hypothetical protein